MPLPLIAAALAGTSIGLTLLNAKAQADAIRANAEFQAKIAELNAQMTEIDAAQVRRDAGTLLARSIGQTTVAMDAQTAAFAAEGVDVVQGSASGDIVGESALNAALNKMDIQNQAFIQESRLRYQASQIRAGANINMINARSSANAAILGGIGSALSQGANAAFNLYNPSTKPVTDTTTSTGGLGSGLSLIPSEPRTALGNGVSLGSGISSELPPWYGHNHWNNIY